MKHIKEAAQDLDLEARNYLFTEKVNKNALSANDDGRIQSSDLIETYAYGTSKKFLQKKRNIDMTI